MTTLNNAFEFLGVSFSLQNVQRRHNAAWFNDQAMGPRTTLQRDMKNALRQGQGANVLNLYSVG